MAVGIFFAAVVSYLSVRVKFLTKSGGVATFILASLIFGLGGIKWSVPILTFFILSSILSKLRKSRNSQVETYFEKSGVRDYLQVIANGGLGGVLVIADFVSPDELYFLIYISILAAVCADTWATEIGTWKKTATYNILNLRQVEQGVSGGISLIGTIGSAAGSITIALSGIFWIDFAVHQYLLLILTAGLLGSLFDSFLGATIQAQNKCVVCEKVTEKKLHCGKETKHNGGNVWISNDVVNLLCGIFGGIIVIILKEIAKV
ncbi:MAG: DUF92 domain-containing protein [Bacteroidetes bacterium]|nr:DUF92 domain-containing protein [Bacteroidota bacterium]